jgi:hypothetical protein
MAQTSFAHLLGMLQVVAMALGEPPVDRHLDPDDLVYNAADMALQLVDKGSTLFLDAERSAHLHDTQQLLPEQYDSRVAPAIKQVQRELVLGVDDPYKQQP